MRVGNACALGVILSLPLAWVSRADDGGALSKVAPVAAPAAALEAAPAAALKEVATAAMQGQLLAPMGEAARARAMYSRARVVVEEYEGQLLADAPLLDQGGRAYLPLQVSVKGGAVTTQGCYVVGTGRVYVHDPSAGGYRPPFFPAFWRGMEDPEPVVPGLCVPPAAVEAPAES